MNSNHVGGSILHGTCKLEEFSLDLAASRVITRLTPKIVSKITSAPFARCGSASRMLRWDVRSKFRHPYICLIRVFTKLSRYTANWDRICKEGARSCVIGIMTWEGNVPSSHGDSDSLLWYEQKCALTMVAWLFSLYKVNLGILIYNVINGIDQAAVPGIRRRQFFWR